MDRWRYEGLWLFGGQSTVTPNHISQFWSLLLIEMLIFLMLYQLFWQKEKASGRNYIWHQGPRERERESDLSKVIEQVSKAARPCTSYIVSVLFSATLHHTSFSYGWFPNPSGLLQARIYMCISQSVCHEGPVLLLLLFVCFISSPSWTFTGMKVLPGTAHHVSLTAFRLLYALLSEVRPLIPDLAVAAMANCCIFCLFAFN